MSTNPASVISVPERLKIHTEPWSAMKWQMLCEMRVAMPGIIRSFDEDAQTVTVDIVIRENIRLNNVATPTAIQTLADIPILLPRAGGFSITLPITAGDECLLIFGDNDFSSWWQNGGVQNQEDRRRHDLSDAFCVLAPWNQTRVLADYSTESLQIRSDDGTIVIDVAEDEISITAPTINLNGDVNITGNLGVSGTTTVTTGSILDGSITVNGSATFNGTTVIEGRGFLVHEHTGVTTGGGITGNVV